MCKILITQSLTVNKSWQSQNSYTLILIPSMTEWIACLLDMSVEE